MSWEWFSRIGDGASIVSSILDTKHLSALSKITNLFKRKGPETPPSDVKDAGAATPASTPTATGGVDSWGKADNYGRSVLRSLYWSTKLILQPGQELLNLKRRKAIGYFTAALGPNKGAAFKRIISLGSGENIVRMTFKEDVPPTAPGGEPTTRPVTQELRLAPDAVVILRGIADDIIKEGGSDEVGQQRAASALVERLNSSDVFANIGDDVAKIRKWFSAKAPVEFGSGATLKTIHEAAQRVGWRVVVNDILWSPRGLALRRQIAEAADEAAKACAHEELRRFIIAATTLAYRATPPKQGLSWSSWVAIAGGLLLLIGLIIIPAIS